MKLVKKAATNQSGLPAALNAATMDRRTFLKRSGVSVGGIAAASSLSLSMMHKARASDEPVAGGGDYRQQWKNDDEGNGVSGAGDSLARS